MEFAVTHDDGDIIPHLAPFWPPKRGFTFAARARSKPNLLDSIFHDHNGNGGIVYHIPILNKTPSCYSWHQFIPKVSRIGAKVVLPVPFKVAVVRSRVEVVEER